MITKPTRSSHSEIRITSSHSEVALVHHDHHYVLHKREKDGWDGFGNIVLELDFVMASFLEGDTLGHHHPV